MKAAINNESLSSVLEVTYSANRLKEVKNLEKAVSVSQVIKDGRLGVASSTELGNSHKLTQKAVHMAEFGPKVGYNFPEKEDCETFTLFCEDVFGLSLKDLIHLGDELASFLASLDKDVQGEVNLRKTIKENRIQSTEGLDFSWPKTSFEISMGLNYVGDKNLLKVYRGHSSTALDFDKELLKSEIEESFNVGRQNVTLPSGTYEVLFTPFAFASLIAPLTACLNGRAVARGISPLANKIDQKLFSPKFSFTNDGVLDKGVASGFYDSQGVACRKTHLIKNGVLKEYFLDLETAKRLGRRPIGTGGIFEISPNNILVAPGRRSAEELVKNIKEAVLIDITMGAWAGNPYGGQVSGNIALGFLLRDGKKVGRIKDSMFSLNIFTHLKRHLLGLSRETKRFGANILPYALVENVFISGKS